MKEIRVGLIEESLQLKENLFLLIQPPHLLSAKYDWGPGPRPTFWDKVPVPMLHSSW